MGRHTLLAVTVGLLGAAPEATDAAIGSDGGLLLPTTRFTRASGHSSEVAARGGSKRNRLHQMLPARPEATRDHSGT